MPQMTDYFENRLVDFLFRGQALGVGDSTAGSGSGPTTFHMGLFTVMPTDSDTGTEVPRTTFSFISAGTNYNRVAVPASLLSWSGTQGVGTTAISTGVGGRITNNNPIIFPAPGTTTWGLILGFGLFDASIAGNLLMSGMLLNPKTVNPGDAAPQFAPGQMSVTFA